MAQLQNIRYNVASNIVAKQVSINRADEDRSGTGRVGQAFWKPPLSTNIADHSFGFHTDVLNAQIPLCRNKAKAFILLLIFQSDDFLNFSPN